MNRSVVLVAIISLLWFSLFGVMVFIERGEAELRSPEGTIAFFDPVDMDHTITWLQLAEPGATPFFKVAVMITDVTRCYAVAFSFRWNASLVNLTDITYGDALDHIDGTDQRIPAKFPGTINFDAGYVRHASIGQLGPNAGTVKTFRDPHWGWLATLTFEYIGSTELLTPELWVPIEIEFLNDSRFSTRWFEYSSYAEGPFSSLVNCVVQDPQLVPSLPAPAGPECPLSIPSMQLTVELAGAFDYLNEEAVPIRIAALVCSRESGAPVSDARVTLGIFDSNGTLWTFAYMTERIVDSGIYEWVSNQTIADLNIKKDVYLVHVQASYQNGPVASAILEFHIDPPSATNDLSAQPNLPWEFEGTPTIVSYSTLSLMIVAGGAILLMLFMPKRETHNA